MERLDYRHPWHRRVELRDRPGEERRLLAVRSPAGLAITQTIRWFEECGDGWRIAEPLRKQVRFQVHNLLEQPPQPGGFDIVLCRNVLLYLCSEKKALAFDRLSSAMADDGWLMLGAGETVIGQTKKLSADPKARGLYRLENRDKSDRRTIQERRAAARA
ncbi:CheR family methyltransferase [Sphingomonas sediminicola]|uniref:CheR family methyltransferase n=1 Tax=Sphingomonas sediminicola TaxID=386874 RepID=UPI0024846C5D|nr:CheR family methyltransferase [Sphingomonas sediminicola]